MSTMKASAPTPANGRRRPRSWPVLLLAAPAFVAIWSGWVGLGGLTGFGMVHPLPGIWDALTVNSAITLPIGVETYAAYALHVWLTGGVDVRATRFAKWSALGSLVLGAAGQVAYHLMMAAGMTHAPWQITAVVACLPVAVLGMGAALAHLVTDSPDTETAPADDAIEAGHAPASLDPAPGYRVDSDAHVEPVEVVAEPAPTPAPRTAAPVVRTARPAGNSMAATVLRLRRQHPDWTVGRIAEKAGCVERTARRHLNATTSTDSPPAPAVPADTDPAPAADVPTDRAA